MRRTSENMFIKKKYERLERILREIMVDQERTGWYDRRINNEYRNDSKWSKNFSQWYRKMNNFHTLLSEQNTSNRENDHDIKIRTAEKVDDDSG